MWPVMVNGCGQRVWSSDELGLMDVASEFLVSVRRNMACWCAIVKSTRMQVLVSRSRASVGGRRCTWVPSRDGNCGQRQDKAFRCSLCMKFTWHSYLQHLGESVES